MEDWLEQMLEKCSKKILQYDSEWNMQTSVCCVPLLKKRGDAVLWNKPQRRLRLSAVARCCPKYKNESSKVSWHTDSSVKNGCDWLRVARLGNSEASDTNRKRGKKKNPGENLSPGFTFSRLLAGDQADDAAVMSPAALQRKLQVPCLRICDARWSGSGPHAYFNSDETPLIIYWNWQLFIHSFSFACILCAHIISACILQVLFQYMLICSAILKFLMFVAQNAIKLNIRTRLFKKKKKRF